jgi:hypothetical protein
MPAAIARQHRDAATAHEAAMRACLGALRTYRRARRFGCPPAYLAACAAELAHARRAARATRRALRLAQALALLGEGHPPSDHGALAAD